ncbi:MAG: heme-binding protein [Pseudomonadota bacterium]
MSKTLALAVIFALATVTGPAMADEETPDYTVVEEVGDIEIRDYPPLLLASVTVTGERQEAAGKAFRILAAFIFGDNAADGKIAMTAPVTQTASEKIAMTAPVTQSAVGEGEWVVDFMMPSKYTMEKVPKPTDPRITLSTTEPYRAAAIRFSGLYTDGNFEKHREALEAFIEKRGLSVDGAPTIAYYNGPFTPFFLRRTEIIYRLATGAASE